MKRILFLFTASLLFLACSKENENPQEAVETTEPTEYKIQKFSITEYYGNGDIYVHDIVYDELGKITNRITHYDEGTVSFNDSYPYNSRDQITSIKQRYQQENLLRRTISYIYTDTAHKLFEIQRTYPDNQNPFIIKFAYVGDTVKTQNDYGTKGKYIYDINRKLIKSIVSGGDMPHYNITETIVRSGDLITLLIT